MIWPDLSIFLERRKEEVILLRANVRKAPKLVRDFNIESDSKMVLFRNGKMVRTARSVYLLGKHGENIFIVAQISRVVSNRLPVHPDSESQSF